MCVGLMCVLGSLQNIYLYIFYSCLLKKSFLLRIRITRELEVEPDQPVPSSPPSESDADSDSQPKSTKRKRSRKDPGSPAAQHLEAEEI